MIDLNMDIYELGLGKKSLFALAKNGIITLGDLLKYNHYSLSKLEGVGDKVLADVVFALKRKNLHLGQIDKVGEVAQSR